MRDAVDATEFFGDDRTPAGPQTYDRYGRYQLDADGKGLKPYTRATTIAKTLEDEYHLSEWKARCAARGVALRDDLVARAKATPVEDKRVWKEILVEAEVVNAGGAKRNMGSAFHEFHERVPTMSPAEFEAQHPLIKATYAKYHAALQQCGIEEILTEVTLVNTKIGSAGKADGIARLRDGRYVIIDRKSGRITEYPHSACQQLAIYANADVMITYDENGATVRHPIPPLDKHMALVLDVTIGDEQTANVAVYELDIWSGWAAALLACSVRRWRNRRDLVTPFHPDAFARSAAEGPSTAANFTISATAGEAYAAAADPSAAGDLAAQVREEVRPIADTMLGINAAVADVSPAAAASVAAHLSDHPAGQATLDAALALPPSGVQQPVEVAHGPAANADLGGPMTQPAHAGHPITKQAWSSAEQRNITLNPDGSRADGLTGPQVSAVLNPDPAVTGGPGELDVEALLAAFKTKAQLQTAAKVVDPAMPLNRTRANLAKDMVNSPRWAAARSTLLPNALRPEGRMPDPSATAEEEFSATVTNAPGPVPPDPTPTRHSQQFTPEEAAITEQQHVPAGPPPWEVPAPAVVEKTPEEQMLDRIAAAATTGPGSELAAVWEYASSHGITWSARLHQAAEIRHKKLAADAAGNGAAQ